MGFGNNGKSLLFFLSKMSRSDFMDVARHVAKDKDVVIVADCNDVMHKVKGRAGDPVEEVAKELLEWARLGAIVKPIYDGDTRHDSKQQHYKNKSNREKNRVQSPDKCSWRSAKNYQQQN